jgi:ribosomal RNA-processing protein 8
MHFESSWDTQTAVSSLSTSTSTKGGRRRKSEDGVVGPSINLDKLMKKMAHVGAGEGGERGKGKGKAKGKAEVGGGKPSKDGKGKRLKQDGEEGTKDKVTVKAKADGKKGEPKTGTTETSPKKLADRIAPATSTPEDTSSSPSKSRGEKRKGDSETAPKSKKQKKREQQQVEAAKSPENASVSVVEKSEARTGSLTALQNSMKSNLEGARFRRVYLCVLIYDIDQSFDRFINEQLYKSSSNDAQELMRQEPQVYAEVSSHYNSSRTLFTNLQYHTGFRHQTKSWPTNPVNLIATSLSSLPPRSVIVDLGCGDAELAKTLVPEGLNVLSFDLVSDGSWVIEADICTRIPLPGSEKSGEDGQAVVDACVCSLSLMSTNWIGCAREAWRVLRMG